MNNLMDMIRFLAKLVALAVVFGSAVAVSAAAFTLLYHLIINL